VFGAVEEKKKKKSPAFNAFLFSPLILRRGEKGEEEGGKRGGGRTDHFVGCSPNKIGKKRKRRKGEKRHGERIAGVTSICKPAPGGRTQRPFLPLLLDRAAVENLSESPGRGGGKRSRPHVLFLR